MPGGTIPCASGIYTADYQHSYWPWQLCRGHTVYSLSWADLKNLLPVHIHIRVKLNFSPSLCQRDSCELHHAFSKAHLWRCEIRWWMYLKTLFSKPLKLLHVCVTHCEQCKKKKKLTYIRGPTRSEGINIKGQDFPRLFAIVCNCCTQEAFYLHVLCKSHL